MYSFLLFQFTHNIAADMFIVLDFWMADTYNIVLMIDPTLCNVYSSLRLRDHSPLVLYGLVCPCSRSYC